MKSIFAWFKITYSAPLYFHQGWKGQLEHFFWSLKLFWKCLANQLPPNDSLRYQCNLSTCKHRWIFLDRTTNSLGASQFIFTVPCIDDSAYLTPIFLQLLSAASLLYIYATLLITVYALCTLFPIVSLTELRLVLLTSIRYSELKYIINSTVADIFWKGIE